MSDSRAGLAGPHPRPIAAQIGRAQPLCARALPSPKILPRARAQRDSRQIATGCPTHAVSIVRSVGRVCMQLRPSGCANTRDRSPLEFRARSQLDRVSWERVVARKQTPAGGCSPCVCRKLRRPDRSPSVVRRAQSAGRVCVACGRALYARGTVVPSRVRRDGGGGKGGGKH
eukprot:6212396-Pleurochrysis_carterae.AAC.1